MHTWQRFTAIAIGVAALHGAALWAVHSYRARTVVADKPAAMETRTVQPPKLIDVTSSVVTPSAIQPPALPAPAAKNNAAIAPAAKIAQSTALPVKPTALTTASTTALAFALPPSDASPSANAASTNDASAAPATAAASAVPVATSQLPVTDADHADTQYRHPRPAISTRLGEAGRVVVHVQVGIDGKALQVQLKTSSGLARLDANALATVARWRFKPGMRGGVPEVMWVDQSVSYDAP